MQRQLHTRIMDLDYTLDAVAEIGYDSDYFVPRDT